jgi:hypothetical protein
MNRVKIFRWWVRGMFQRLRCWILKPPAWIRVPTRRLYLEVRRDGIFLRGRAEDWLPGGWTPPEHGHYEIEIVAKILSHGIIGEEILADPNAPEVKPTLLRDLEDPTVKAGFWRRKPS